MHLLGQSQTEMHVDFDFYKLRTRKKNIVSGKQDFRWKISLFFCSFFSFFDRNSIRGRRKKSFRINCDFYSSSTTTKPLLALHLIFHNPLLGKWGAALTSNFVQVELSSLILNLILKKTVYFNQSNLTLRFISIDYRVLHQFLYDILCQNIL